MAIARLQFGDIGGHMPVEGPLSAVPTGVFTTKPGTVIEGDAGSEFVFCTLNVNAGFIANQGDVYCWDQQFQAGRASEFQATGAYDLGMQVGTLYLGGQTGDSTSQAGSLGAWSTTFATGTYGVWMQRCGSALALVNALTTPALPTTMGDSAVAGSMTFLTPGTHSNAIAPGTIALMPTSKTVTANTVTGSSTLTAVAGVGRAFAQVGMRVTGTGIPTTTTAPATIITKIDGPTWTLSAACTATNTGTTVTVLNGSSSCTTSTNTLLTNVPTITGFYPNQLIVGTGIAALCTIVSITGASPNYTILLSAATTATASNISIATFTAPSYFEVLLSWPYFTTLTV